MCCGGYDCCCGTAITLLAAQRTGPLQHEQNNSDHSHALQPAVTRKTTSTNDNVDSLDTPSISQRVSTQQSHQALLSDLKKFPSAQQLAALARLHVAFAVAKKDLSLQTLDTAIKDLDTTLFNGRLNDKIVVNWAEMPVTSDRILRGMCFPQGIDRNGITKVCIPLNKAMFRLESKEEIWVPLSMRCCTRIFA